ncbi:MAG: DUF3179 domain-containing protein [Chloroflexi bacterium]|nr:DUF3179 domain-containing protein [Chloroflexota bacterium]
MVYARNINGSTHTFGVSGKLIKNALVMYDHQSDTLWSQFLSRGVKGPLSGTSLEILPALQTTWQQWLELHPDTLVLDKLGRYQRDTYEGYYRGGSAGILGEFNKDKRLSGKDLVLGVVQDGAAKAYPFRVMTGQPVINDFWAGKEVLVVFESISETGAIFERRLENRSLTFELVPGDPFLIRDLETGSTWQALTGRAIDGPLAGEVLTRLTSNYSFWFAWSDFYPDTQLY